MALGVQPRTLHVWFSDDLVKAEVRRLAERIEDAFTERLASAGLRALEELSDFSGTNARKVQAHCQAPGCGWFGDRPMAHGAVVAVGDDQVPQCNGPWRLVEYITEATKLEALREVLDRVPHTVKIRDRAEAQRALPPGDTTTNYLAIFQNLPDAELAGLIQQWAASGALDGDAAADAPSA